MKAEDLKKLLEPLEYKTRVGPGGKSLAYIDARQAQDRLDEVCGIQNWKVEYKEHRGELFAGVSIRVQVGFEPGYNNTLAIGTQSLNPSIPVYEWITKWDGGSETKIEGEKGVISDSFKRACVVWGLGRFLYSIKPTGTSTTKPTYNNDERGLKDCINDMKKATTAEDRVKFKDEGKEFAKSEKQIKWLTDEWNKLG